MSVAQGINTQFNKVFGFILSTRGSAVSKYRPGSQEFPSAYEKFRSAALLPFRQEELPGVAQGINTQFNKVFGFILSNGIVALAGALLAQYSGKADINDGRGAIPIVNRQGKIIERNLFIDGAGVEYFGDTTDFKHPVFLTSKDRALFKEMLKELNLGLEDRLSTKVGLLSGGQRQAITLLMATLQKPKLLLLDEHTAALDLKTAAKVLELTETIIREHALTALMVTHNMKDAIRLGNRLIMMADGKII